MIIIERRSDPNAAGSLVDIEALGIHDFKPSYGYSHAHRVEFKVRAPNHTLPFTLADYLVIWDTDYPFESSSQDDTNPFFEGWVEEPDIGQETNVCTVVAYDPRFRHAKRHVVMNGPTAEPEAYPRAVFNVANDNDDDYAYSILQNATLAQIIQQLLLDAQPDLYELGCSPQAPNLPYVEDDLGGFGSSDSDSDSITDWVGGLDFIPQEKIVSQSETLFALLQRILSQYAPATKMFWQPGERKFRFFKVKEAPQRTITCNDLDDPDQVVLGLEIHRSAEGRYGAVKFFGPEGVEWSEAEWNADSSAGNTLEPIEYFTEGTPPNDYTCYRKFVITDPDFTRIVRKGPYQVYVPGPFTIWTNASGSIQGDLMNSVVQTWSPSFQVRFADAAWGSGNWKTLTGWRMDLRSGVIDFGETCIARWKGPGNGVDEPIGFKFVYPRLTEPLTVRYPESGFEGTIESVAGIENELKQYDESLAVGKSYGIPVTTTLRQNRYKKMARQIHDARKDLVYAGTITLEGLHYDFLKLNQRINIAAKTDDGDPLTTGLESVGAILTDCELDPEEFTTTLQFSSDQLEILGIDPELMKRRLGIRQADLQFRFYANVAFSYRKQKSGLGINYTQQYMHIDYGNYAEWVDDLGNIQ